MALTDSGSEVFDALSAEFDAFSILPERAPGAWLGQVVIH
jgi:hypothetical protein